MAKSETKTDWSSLGTETVGKINEEEKRLSGKTAPTTTGEENETTKFSSRAKLFEFDSVSREWKERGIGIVKINEDQITGDARILMRSEGVLRVLINARLFPGMQFAGVPDRSVRLVNLCEGGKPVQYLLRLKSNEDANALLFELSIYCKDDTDEFE